MSELQSLYTQYRDNPSPAISNEIIGMLSSWLSGHILETDMRYKPYMKE
ncbi:MAG: hypothetical protein HQ512_09775 [Rhodospirillales bacterium]|nr:hypothetical protein [Rhodospirillales bacterium]